MRKNEALQQSESRHRIEIDSLTNQIQACQATITTLTQQQQTRDFVRTEALVQLNQQACKGHSTNPIKAYSSLSLSSIRLNRV